MRHQSDVLNYFLSPSDHTKVEEPNLTQEKSLAGRRQRFNSNQLEGNEHKARATSTLQPR
jgi:hypothetical protein